MTNILQLFPFFILLASLSTICVGIYVLLLSPKERLNQAFFAICFFGWYLGFTTFMQTYSESIERALFWEKAGSFWYFILPVAVSFILVFAGKSKIHKQKIVLLLLYGPAFLLSFVNLFTNEIVVGVSKTPWGYSTISNQTGWALFSGLFPIIYVLITFIINIWAFFTISDEKKKKQSVIFLLGSAFPMILGILTQAIPEIFSIPFPDLTLFGAVLQQIVFTYGIKKYQLFRLNPASIAEDIIKTMPESLFVTDQRGIIQFSNLAAMRLTQEENSLYGKSIQTYFSFKYEEILKEKSFISEYETVLDCHNNKKIPVSLSISSILSSAQTIQGYIIIANNITALKKREEELHVSNERLEKSLEELKQMNSFMVDREIRMVELKKKIEELKSAEKPS